MDSVSCCASFSHPACSKADNRPHVSGTLLRFLVCVLAVHFEIAYNGDRIIEINVSTDPSQVVDISEDVVKVTPR